MSFDAVGVVTKNIERSIEFFNILGLEFTEYGQGHFEATTKSGVRLMLDTLELMKQVNPAYELPQGSGIVLAFNQDSSQAVDEVFNKLIKAGFKAEKEPWDAFWGNVIHRLKMIMGIRLIFLPV